MDDSELSRYIPAFGDRVNLRSLSKPDTGRKAALFDKLRSKMKLQTKGNCDESDANSSRPTRSFNLRGNKNAQKLRRKIELGWMHNGKHVRSSNGGGSRKIELPRDAKKADILEVAKEIFFPNGQSKKNILLTAVSCNVLDFAQTEFEDKISIAEMYDTVKMGMLCFHLCTKTKNGACSENKEDELTKKSSEDLETESDNELPEIEETISDVESIRDPVLPDSDVTPTKRSKLSLTLTCPVPDNHEIGTSTVRTEEPLPVLMDSFNEAFFNTDVEITIEEVMPRSPSPPPEEKLTTIVHRVKVLEELIEMFKSPQIIKKSIQFSFINEAGADQSGVSRDVYTSFWADFFSRVAEGEDFRVPALNPQWQVEEWKSVGKILVKGLLDHNIFPLNFAPAYVTALLFGEHSISEKTLLDSFLLYLSKSERDLAKVAIERKLSADENEDFLDMLDRLGSKTIPTFENMQEELLKMAHKELIQKPKYALEKMAEVCRNEIIVQIPSEVDLLEMYESKRPSVRKVLKMISSNPQTPAENQCLQYFKQYIKAQESQKSIQRLLRFLTGTDILCVEKIEVTFTKLIGIERRPIAHTGGPTLELPCTYMSYIEFRYELDNILQSDHCMEMNIA